METTIWLEDLLMFTFVFAAVQREKIFEKKVCNSSSCPLKCLELNLKWSSSFFLSFFILCDSRERTWNGENRVLYFCIRASVSFKFQCISPKFVSCVLRPNPSCRRSDKRGIFCFWEIPFCDGSDLCLSSS